MPSLRSLLLLAPALVAQAGALPTSCSPGSNSTAGKAKAIYFLTNNEKNSVAALQLGRHGMLTGSARVAETGGAGGVSIDMMTNVSSTTDSLVSQSALTIAGHSIFAVNPGSSTLSMFSIDPRDATRLTLVGAPAKLPGEFPNTVAASTTHGLVCVGMTGAVAGISCAPFTPAGGLGTFDTLRPFALNQSTPPTAPLNTVSQVFFSGDESRLFATVKGNPGVNNTGFFAVYNVQGGNGSASVSSTGVMSSPKGTAVLFGSQPLAGSATEVFVTDASFGAASLTVDPTTGQAALTGMAPIADQVATCWAVISPATGTAFVTDVKRDRLIEVSTQNAKLIGEPINLPDGDLGLIDLVAAGKLVYALAPGNGTSEAAVAVVDVVTRERVQHVGLMGIGATNKAMGMKILVV